MEPWSADDPWQERRDSSPGWDEWPPPAPPADEHAVDEPEPPASDPWAESWNEDVPGIPSSPPPAGGDRDAERLTDAVIEPPPAPDFEPPFAEPEPMPDAAVEPEPERVAEPEPVAEPASFVPPHIEPWSPDPDPWGASWAMPEAVEEPAREEPAAEEPVVEELMEPVAQQADAEAPAAEAPEEPAEPIAVVAEEPPAEAPEEPAAPIAVVAEEPPAEAPEESPAEPMADTPIEGASAEEPAAEPIPEPEREAEEIGDAPEVGAHPGIAAALEEPSEEDWPELELDPEPALWTGPAEPTTVSVNGNQPAPEALPPWETWDADIERVAEPEPPPFLTPLWAAPPGTEAEDEEAGAEPDTRWEADLWAEPEEEAEPSTTAPAAEAGPEPERPEAEPVPDEQAAAEAARAASAAALAAAEQAGAQPPPATPPWPERMDQTEVLPTTWAPPRPPEAGEGDGIEARTGEVRTTLGRAEPELDDELAEEATTAEQAVPWLIGVILLLAGMVIVLLALIFAGDASLGGGAGGSPSPSLAALGPGGSGDPSVAPSPTPRPSETPSESASAQPSETPAGAPEYGDLEMVYQGRSAALEPIYLLRRDFTVEDEPVVVTQDADLDVRRFAWSADGTRGAALYADVLVGIDPGEAVRHLAEGVSAITFGADAETVYAVRISADGDNDVATILAVNQQSGAQQELDRVSYPRPEIGEEAAVAEAQFLDDGGAIRLFWMNDDRLRLWILGGGAWTVHPTEGNATALDEPELPVLWAPDGERRVGFAVDGNTTTIRMVDRSRDELATATVTGRASHVRWSPSGDQVVFTLGRSTSGGGVIQDLYLWNLGEGEDPAPTQITNTGAAFGAEWLGSQPRWEE